MRIIVGSRLWRAGPGGHVPLAVLCLLFTHTASAHITELIPPEITAGGPAFTLVALGADIEIGETLLWNGMPLATTFVSEGEVRAAIPAALIAANLFPARGTVTITLQGFNSLMFFVNPPIAIVTTSPLPVGTVGAGYSQTLARTGGTAGFTWSITAGTLPPGLALNAATGAITGTPTGPGVFPFTARVTDRVAATAERQFTLTVGASGPQITTASPLPDAILSTAYSQSLAATGGTLPYTWSLVGSSLPPGLSLNPASGALSGTPAIGGTFTFTARVMDANGAQASKQFTLTITMPGGFRHRLIIPHLADGETWKTTFTIVNGSTTTGFTAQIRFYSSSGGALALDLLQDGRVSTLTRNVPPGGSTVIETSGTDPALSVGWAEILTTTGTLSSFAVFRQRVGGRPDFEATSPGVTLDSTEIVFAFDNLESFVTSLALANATPVAANVTARFRSESGATLHEESFALAAQGHTSFETTNRFPLSQSRRGSVSFSVTSGRLAPLGFRFNPTGPFTSVPHQVVQ